jgi:hypothetical protein
MRSEVREAVINATPETLFARLCELAENPSCLRRHGEAGYEYVLRWHDPSVVARQTTMAYEN